VTKQEYDFHDIQVSGDWASEWGTTVQVVQPPDGKPAIESHGKILLVLHKEKDGVWRIKQEMWNAGARP
jgi:ketosteroid isomerase-like protein